jgi:hypothetical protein
MRSAFPFIVAVSLVAGGCMMSQQGQSGDREKAKAVIRAMTIDDVIALKNQEASDNAIIEQIRETNSTFVLRPDDIHSLYDVGVSRRVVREMMYPNGFSLSLGNAARSDGSIAWPWSKYERPLRWSLNYLDYPLDPRYYSSPRYVQWNIPSIQIGNQNPTRSLQ